MSYYGAYVGIFPKSDFARISSTANTVPLGQLVIATSVRYRFSSLPVKVFDGDITNEDEICSEIRQIAGNNKKVLVGITLQAGNIGSALQIAQRLTNVSNNNCDVIMGGPEAWMGWLQFGKEMLADKAFIKGLVIGAGEHVVPLLIESGISYELPGVVVRDSTTGKLKPCSRGPSLIDFLAVHVDYNLLNNISKTNGISYLWKLDCTQAGTRCYFCGRPSYGNGFRNPPQVWQEITSAVNKYENIKVLYNVADSIASSKRDLRNFIRMMPTRIGRGHIYHRIFINTCEIDSEIIDILTRLNAIAAVGIESYTLFDKVGKARTSMNDNERAIKYLHDAKIPMILSFVLGLPTESLETLEQTGEWIYNIAKKYYPTIASFEISPLLVTTGSRAFKDIWARRRRQFQHLVPPIDPVQMTREYFLEMCNRLTREATVKFIAGLAKQINLVSRDISIDVKGLLIEEVKQYFS